MPNKLGNFKGVSLHESYQGHMGGCSLFKGPASIDIDPKGRVFVSEAKNRKGVPDNRRVDWRIYGIIVSKQLRID